MKAKQSSLEDQLKQQLEKRKVSADAALRHHYYPRSGAVTPT
jgi:hypothetical protein